MEECLAHEDVCIEWHGIQGSCSLYQKQCTENYSYCHTWKTQCAAGERVKTCALYRFVDDVDMCEEFIFACETTGSVRDKACLRECQNRI